MNLLQISSALCNFQTLVFRYDKNYIMIVSREGNANFNNLIGEWKEKYACKGGNYQSIEIDGICLTNEQSILFFQDYPNLKSQLEMNEKYGYDIWISIPGGISRESLDLVHTPEDNLYHLE